MRLWRLINPSDPYTFVAPDELVAGACVCLLSSAYGASTCDSGPELSTPMLFGWEGWLAERGITAVWCDEHAADLAACYESFLIGSPEDRADVEAMLALIPEDKREQWRADRQNRHRSSLSRIGERAYQLAASWRKRAEERAAAANANG